MNQRRAVDESPDSLQVEVIDDVGRVVATVYVDDLTGSSCPALPRRAPGDRTRVRSDVD